MIIIGFDASLLVKGLLVRRFLELNWSGPVFVAIPIFQSPDATPSGRKNVKAALGEVMPMAAVW
jgi:hypothetical protein